jgi:hypothetical protein
MLACTSAAVSKCGMVFVPGIHTGNIQHHVLHSVCAAVTGLLMRTLRSAQPGLDVGILCSCVQVSHSRCLGHAMHTKDVYIQHVMTCVSKQTQQTHRLSQKRDACIMQCMGGPW